MNTARTRRAGESGSVLLGTLVLVFVLLVLGLALFDSALIDSQLAMASLDDYRALESAQAGLQIALYRLHRHLCGGDAGCANPSPVANWVDGIIDGQPFPVSVGALATFISQTTSFRGTFPDPRGAGYPSEEYTGTYAVALKHLTQQEARDASFTYSNGVEANVAVGCTPRIDTDLTCRDLIYVRATGTFGRTDADQGAVRTIQAVVQARAYGAGVASVAVLAETIVGSPRVHGSLHMVPCADGTCSPLNLSAGSGTRNNYNRMPLELPLELQSIVPSLPVVRCPPSWPCAGAEVETLQATVRIGTFPGETVAVNIQSPDASLGESGGLPGKPTMDGVYLGEGCSSEDCLNVVSNPGRVFADRPIRAYDRHPPPSLPQLTDAVQVVGVTRDEYAACSGPGACNSSGDAVAGLGKDFFISHAFRIGAGTVEDPRGNDCDEDGLLRIPGGTSPCELQNLYRLLTSSPSTEPDPRKRWTPEAPTFTKTFQCTGAEQPVLGCQAGTRTVTGSVEGAGVPSDLQAPSEYVLEWRGKDWPMYGGNASDVNTLRIYACGAGCPTRYLLTPSDPNVDVVFPLLIYLDGPLRVCQGCSGTTFYYLGHAIFLVGGTAGPEPSIVIDAALRAGPPTFPAASLLSLYTPGSVSLFNESVPPPDPAAVMGRFYAGVGFRTTGPIHVVGSAVARAFQAGTAVPRFWEVKLPLTLTALPYRGPQIEPSRPATWWSVATLKWKECPPGPLTNQPC